MIGWFICATVTDKKRNSYELSCLLSVCIANASRCCRLVKRFSNSNIQSWVTVYCTTTYVSKYALCSSLTCTLWGQRTSIGLIPFHFHPSVCTWLSYRTETVRGFLSLYSTPMFSDRPRNTTHLVPSQVFTFVDRWVVQSLRGFCLYIASPLPTLATAHFKRQSFFFSNAFFALATTFQLLNAIRTRHSQGQEDSNNC